MRPRFTVTRRDARRTLHAVRARITDPDRYADHRRRRLPRPLEDLALRAGRHRLLQVVDDADIHPGHRATQLIIHSADGWYIESTLGRGRMPRHA